MAPRRALRVRNCVNGFKRIGNSGAALLAALAVAGCAGPRLSAPHQLAEARFVCEDAVSFGVRRSATAATVSFGDGDYRLERKRSSIGERFASPGATLIIDGDFAAFVAEDRLGLDGCRSAQAVAQAPPLRP